MRVFLDNGHGGKDPGAVAPSGQTEAKTNLNTTNQVMLLLKKDGHQCLMSNPLLMSMDLNSRFAAANSFRADTCASIHYNAGGGKYTVIFYQMNNPKSKQLADAIALEFKNKYPGRRIKVETKPSKKYPGHDYYAALAIPKMPAVLIEFCFMDSETTMIDTLREQQDVAACIYLGHKRYFKNLTV